MGGGLNLGDRGLSGAGEESASPSRSVAGDAAGDHQVDDAGDGRARGGCSAAGALGTGVS